MCYHLVDSNKDRRRKRSAIAKEKSKLEEAITSYNALVSNAEAVDPADTLLAQDFSIWPWEKVEIGTGNIIVNAVFKSSLSSLTTIVHN